MSERSEARKRTALIAVIAILMPLAFFVLFERVEEEAETGFRGPALVNPYLASERFLAAMGVPARSVWDLEELPPTDHLVVLLPTDPAFRVARRDELLEWVAGGGHLLLPVPDMANAPLTAELGFVVLSTKEDADTGAGEGALLGGLMGEPLHSPVVALTPWRGGPGGAALEAEVPLEPRLAHPEADARWEASGPEGEVVTPILSVPYGMGRVTALTGSAFLRSDRAGDYDHAALLWALAHAGPRPAGATIVLDGGAPGLLALLWRHAWMAVLSLGALIFAACARAARRLGPLLPPPARARRRLMEHIAASGAFLWRQGGRAALLASAREQAGLRPLDPGSEEALIAHDARGFVRAMQELQSRWRSR